MNMNQDWIISSSSPLLSTLLCMNMHAMQIRNAPTIVHYGFPLVSLRFVHLFRQRANCLAHTNSYRNYASFSGSQGYKSHVSLTGSEYKATPFSVVLIGTKATPPLQDLMGTKATPSLLNLMSAKATPLSQDLIGHTSLIGSKGYNSHTFFTVMDRYRGQVSIYIRTNVHPELNKLS